MNFEWDPTKAKTNLKKHNVSFEEASMVFLDPLALIFFDKWHSEQEEREIIIGHSANRRLLLVSFTEREGIVRIISSREATRQERRDYEETTYFSN